MRSEVFVVGSAVLGKRGEIIRTETEKEGNALERSWNEKGALKGKESQTNKKKKGLLLKENIGACLEGTLRYL